MSKTTNKFAPETQERAVRIMTDHERDRLSLGRGGLYRGCHPQTRSA
jgi:hypothetical protein